MAQQQDPYPLQFSVDYPDRPLDRLSSFFRVIAAIPIVIVLVLVSAGSLDDRKDAQSTAGFVGGIVLFAPVLMILFRQKYPRWWFDWNLALLRFGNRVGVYLCLLRDEYPSTDEEQAVHLEVPYPDAKKDIDRWLPLLKWLLAIPHYMVLVALFLALVAVVIGAWFAILFTTRYPRSLFDFVVGVIRWSNRVTAYAFLLATDKYPPFRFSP
ncbi:MAG: conserved hypothetical rane protein [Dehalococcoidia bacterium]|nr:conserved hypothetical rane protein [Dehalococcoidia bacterium]